VSRRLSSSAVLSRKNSTLLSADCSKESRRGSVIHVAVFHPLLSFFPPLSSFATYLRAEDLELVVKRQSQQPLASLPRDRAEWHKLHFHGRRVGPILAGKEQGRKKKKKEKRKKKEEEGKSQEEV
jgi:hypothetical protein